MPNKFRRTIFIKRGSMIGGVPEFSPSYRIDAVRWLRSRRRYRRRRQGQSRDCANSIPRQYSIHSISELLVSNDKKSRTDACHVLLGPRNSKTFRKKIRTTKQREQIMTTWCHRQKKAPTKTKTRRCPMMNPILDADSCLSLFRSYWWVIQLFSLLRLHQKGCRWEFDGFTDEKRFFSIERSTSACFNYTRHRQTSALEVNSLTPMKRQRVCPVCCHAWWKWNWTLRIGNETMRGKGRVWFCAKVNGSISFSIQF